MKITVSGIGYVGLSNAIILAKFNKVYAVDIIQSKVDLINARKSLIIDKEIEEFLLNEKLDLLATTDAELAIRDSEIVVIATPTLYDPITNKFDTSSVESVINQVKRVNPNAWVVVKSMVGVGFTKQIIKKPDMIRFYFLQNF